MAKIVTAYTPSAGGALFRLESEALKHDIYLESQAIAQKLAGSRQGYEIEELRKSLLVLLEAGINPYKIMKLYRKLWCWKRLLLDALNREKHAESNPGDLPF